MGKGVVTTGWEWVAAAGSPRPEPTEEEKASAEYLEGQVDLEALLEAVHTPIHLVGGPCIYSAPKDHTFTEAMWQVTCKLCKMEDQLNEGEVDPPKEPDGYAKAFVQVLKERRKQVDKEYDQLGWPRAHRPEKYRWRR